MNRILTKFLREGTTGTSTSALARENVRTSLYADKHNSFVVKLYTLLLKSPKLRLRLQAIFNHRLK